MKISLASIRAHEKPLEGAILIVWGLILFTLPFIYVPINSQLIILLFLLSLLFYYKRRPKIVRLVPFVFVYLIPFILLLLSLIFVSRANVQVLEKEAATVLFPLTTFLLLNANFKITKKVYHKILFGFLISIWGVIAFTLIRSTFYSELFFTRNFLTFGIIHPTYFSLYVGVSIFICLELSRYYVRKHVWAIWLIVIGMLAYMMALSSRIPLISTVIVLSGALFFSRASLKQKLVYLLLSLSILLVATIAVNNSPRLEYRFVLALEKNLNTRIVSWNGAMEIFRDHPILGVGAGLHQQHLNSFYLNNVSQPEKYIDYNAHNYVLHILMTFGLTGAILILVFWIFIIRIAILRHNELLIKFLILYGLCLTTEVMTVTQKGIVFFYAFYSLNLLAAVDTNDIHKRQALDKGNLL